MRTSVSPRPRDRAAGPSCYRGLRDGRHPLPGLLAGTGYSTRTHLSPAADRQNSADRYQRIQPADPPIHA